MDHFFFLFSLFNSPQVQVFLAAPGDPLSPRDVYDGCDDAAAAAAGDGENNAHWFGARISIVGVVERPHQSYWPTVVGRVGRSRCRHPQCLQNPPLELAHNNWNRCLDCWELINSFLIGVVRVLA